MSDLSHLADRLVGKFALGTRGSARTALPGVHLHANCRPSERCPMLYRSGLVILVRGRKHCHLNGRRFDSAREPSLALGLPLAMECETVASPEAPLFGIYLEADPLFVRDVARATRFPPVPPESRAPAVAVAPVTPEMRDAIRRLMEQLCSDSDTAILGAGTVREILYRALLGPAGVALRGLLNREGPTTRVAGVMEEIHRRFADRFSIDEMARMAGMSPSAFHRAFREATDDTPLQYLKKVRLGHACALILHEGYRVGSAASAVGYESAAQFSRDFRSHFGVSAADARRAGLAVPPMRLPERAPDAVGAAPPTPSRSLR